MTATSQHGASIDSNVETLGDEIKRAFVEIKSIQRKCSNQLALSTFVICGELKK